MVDHGHRLYVADADEKCCCGARAENGNDDEMNGLFVGGGVETMIG